MDRHLVGTVIQECLQKAFEKLNIHITLDIGIHEDVTISDKFKSEKRFFNEMLYFDEDTLIIYLHTFRELVIGLLLAQIDVEMAEDEPQWVEVPIAMWPIVVMNMGEIFSSRFDKSEVFLKFFDKSIQDLRLVQIVKNFEGVLNQDAIKVLARTMPTQSQVTELIMSEVSKVCKKLEAEA